MEIGHDPRTRARATMTRPVHKSAQRRTWGRGGHSSMNFSVGTWTPSPSEEAPRVTRARARGSGSRRWLGRRRRRHAFIRPSIDPVVNCITQRSRLYRVPGIFAPPCHTLGKWSVWNLDFPWWLYYSCYLNELHVPNPNVDPIFSPLLAVTCKQWWLNVAAFLF